MRRAVPIEEVADLLSVEPVTVRRLIARGELKAQRVGRAVRVFVDSLDAFQRGATIEPEAPRMENVKRVSRSHRDAMSRLAGLGIK